MESGIIIALIGILSTTISSVVTYILTKRKYNAEVDSSVIQNLEKSVDLYKKICDDNSRRIDEYQKENQELRNKIIDLEKQVTFLKGKLCFTADCKYRTLEDNNGEIVRKNGNKTQKDSKKA